MVLDVQALSYTYPKSDKGVHNVSFTVQQGQVTGLLGPNGSGKSTLFKCCLHLLKKHSGQILLHGKPIEQYPVRKLAQVVAYVPQEHTQAFPFLVEEVVAMGRTAYANLYGGEKNKQRLIAHALEDLGIPHLAGKPFNQLSGGQRQLVLLARAIVQGAPLLLLDEPTAALDFHNQQEIWALLRRLAAQGKAILVCAHDPNHILWFCDTTLLLQNGNLLASGTPSALFTQGFFQQLYPNSTSKWLEEKPILMPG